jgi:hypothetical protein
VAEHLCSQTDTHLGKCWQQNVLISKLRGHPNSVELVQLIELADVLPKNRFSLCLRM